MHKCQRDCWSIAWLYAKQYALPRNAIPVPVVLRTQQRAQSPLVDIDYKVTDADDTNVYTAASIFTNASSTMSLSNCLRQITWVEDANRIGPNVTANQTHRLTWNAGADWSVNLGDCRVTVLARDSRTNLLDIHYLSLPADRVMPALMISRSPLTPMTLCRVGRWLLATNDIGIMLTSNRLYGVGGIRRQTIARQRDEYR